MSGLNRVIRSGVRRRRVQTVVIALVAAAAVTASVLGAGLLVASEAPFDDAFAAQRGPHLTVQADPAHVTAAQLTASASASGVSDAAGPYPLLVVPMGTGSQGLRLPPLTLVARADPGGAVDRVELIGGRWATGPGELVMGGGMVRLPPGHTVTTAGGTKLTVVGTARSVSDTAGGWIAPSAVATLDEPGVTHGLQMLYRLTDPAQVSAGRDAVAATLPAGAVVSARSWLDVRQDAVEDAAVFVPFLVAFALLGIVMAVLVVGTVIAGTVGAATRRIGILKALGCTPGGIVRAYVAQALIPASIGALAGAVVGNLIALPVLAETEELYGSANTTIDWWVTLLAAGGVLAVVAATGWAAALRAGRLRTVDAIAVGRASGPVRGRWASRLAARLPVPRPIGLGLARPLARPVRTAAILLAVAAGAAAVTFASGLGTSLVRIETALDQNTADVTVSRSAGGPPGGGAPGGSAPAFDSAAVLAAIAAQEGTRAAYGVAEAPVTVVGIADPVRLTAFTGDASWAGFEMVSGRWFTAPGETVASAPLLKAAGIRVGDSLTVRSDDGTTISLHIVGEVFESSPSVFTSTATVPSLQPAEFPIALTDGTDAGAYAEKLTAALTAQALTARPTGADVDPMLLLIQGLTATLTLLLLAVAALGVLNMLVLDLRDRVHDLGIHKALGMTPKQTIAMVIASVAGVGLVGGLLGVPLGITMQRLVVPSMAASGGLHLPASLLDVYGPALLAALALGGPAVALLGALLPAGWAARTRTATALRTE
ncbi:FtsX-like permease family protein [Actinoplanes awajinensis]|uniref:ABC transporter permease n=1 Tax=Actinoplanes awajinensis subsp. mycoplanecinus TaxID=135947 RepID=A0A101JB88_9ACTN|nr:FtsX-like permease family protein [Actinoplanes awajinensis]KUL23586.1 ABC transporter permease [Actinoplanes awajinensis subsp. mycoplanecinus]